ncbi:MFS transporter [Allostreptomyces psammosilenae]|uniref:Major facilitator superfamily (MFS) profile domain-containing protein n=1 Tax=Allostreptomyces psammosilenae TaxID=1892865 RepID=A0A853A264_9ACTN|nr:MFS transporter [Allostreptomyces psammosilenae]NYI07550.1 hypothetical protein [Allostreptomyces psammosilenae]
MAHHPSDRGTPDPGCPERSSADRDPEDPEAAGRTTGPAPLGRTPGPVAGPARLLPPPGPLRGYAVLTLTMSFGRGIFLAGAVLYFTQVVGVSGTQAGTALTVSAFAGMAAAVPGGVLSDRFGHRRVLLGLLVLQAVLFALWPLAGSFGALLLLSAAMGIVEGASRPVRAAYLGHLAGPEQRVAARAYNRAVLNAGIAAGALLAGVVLSAGSPSAQRLLFEVNALGLLLATAVLLRLPDSAGTRRIRSGGEGAEPVPRTSPEPAEPPVAPGSDSDVAATPGGPAGPAVPAAPGVPDGTAVPAGAAGKAVPAARRVSQDRRYQVLALLCGLMSRHTELTSVALPLWVVLHDGVPPWVVSACLLVNTLMAVTLQVWISRGTESVPAAVGALRRAGWAILAGCGLAAVSGAMTVPWMTGTLLVAVAAITVGELLASAGEWELSFGMAPTERLGEYQGAWSLFGQACGALAPMAVGAALSAWGAWAWLAFGAVFPLAAALTGPAAGGRPVRARRV